MSRMLEEIRQQPDTLERTLRRELKRIEKFEKLVEKRRPRLIVLAARGTSDNAAQFGRYLLEITTGIPTADGRPFDSEFHPAADSGLNIFVGENLCAAMTFLCHGRRDAGMETA